MNKVDNPVPFEIDQLDSFGQQHNQVWPTPQINDGEIIKPVQYVSKPPT
ncbi:hypothetical protein [Thaumasiovibrio subtropicus]|nr:hypothetical protein [Thaumasiovibrio subtropicus]